MKLSNRHIKKKTELSKGYLVYKISDIKYGWLVNSGKTGIKIIGIQRINDNFIYNWKQNKAALNLCCPAFTNMTSIKIHSSESL